MNGDEFASPDICLHFIWAEEPLLEELDGMKGVKCFFAPIYIRI
jgi:hypothetical protein